MELSGQICANVAAWVALRMEGYSSLAAFRIEKAQDRCKILLEEIRRLESEVYSSPASKLLLCFVRECTGTLADFLQEENTLAASQLLRPEETEIRVQRATKVIPWLHAILGFVAGSQINQTPSHLIIALRRYVRDTIPGSDIIVSSKPELNYSITEIASKLRSAFEGLPMERSCDRLPTYLFVVTLPTVERDQVLLHGIISHELGHPLAEAHHVVDTVLSQIPPKGDLIKRYAEQILAQSAGDPDVKDLPPPFVDLLIRSKVTTEVNDRVTRWLRELCSDAIGARLFGPAYFFAFAHFFLSFAHLDHASRTHPPARLRLKLMARLLSARFRFDNPEEEGMDRFFRDWSAVASRKVACWHPYDQIAVQHIEDDTILDLISKETELALCNLVCYSQDDHRRDIAGLSPLLVSVIPPGEKGPFGAEEPVSIVSILNVGWFVYVCEFPSFTRNLHEAEREKKLAADRLQRILLKALEISETRTKWREAKGDSRSGTN